MGNSELTDRLYAVVPPLGYSRTWARLTGSIKDDEILMLLNAFEGASAEDIDLIIALICDEPEKGRELFGVDGWITEGAIQYARFVIAVAPIGNIIKRAKEGSFDPWTFDEAQAAARHCFAEVGAENQSSEEYQRRAKATMVCYAANGKRNLQDADYIASHYDGLEPYFEFIIRSGDTTRSQLNMLLTTKPLVPLSKGLL